MEFITFWDIWDFFWGDKNTPKNANVDYSTMTICDIHDANFIIKNYELQNTKISKEKYYEAKVKRKLFTYDFRVPEHSFTSISTNAVNSICKYFLESNGNSYENLHNFMNDDIGIVFLQKLKKNIYNYVSANSSAMCDEIITNRFFFNVKKAVEDSLIEAEKINKAQIAKTNSAKLVIKGFSNIEEPTYNRVEEFVYCIGANTDKYNKIGKSCNPDERLKQLQTGNPTQLFLKYSGKVTSSKFVEDELHKIFRNSNIIINGNKEWFEVPSWKIINEIRKYEKTS